MCTKHVSLILAILIYLPLSIRTWKHVSSEYANDSWLLRVNRIGVIITLVLSSLGTYSMMRVMTNHIGCIITLPRMVLGIVIYMITRSAGTEMGARGMHWILITFTIEDTYPYMETNPKKVWLIAIKHLFFGWILTTGYSTFIVGMFFGLLINMSVLY